MWSAELKAMSPDFNKALITHLLPLQGRKYPFRNTGTPIQLAAILSLQWL